MTKEKTCQLLGFPESCIESAIGETRISRPFIALNGEYFGDLSNVEGISQQQVAMWDTVVGSVATLLDPNSSSETRQYSAQDLIDAGASLTQIGDVCIRLPEEISPKFSTNMQDQMITEGETHSVRYTLWSPEAEKFIPRGSEVRVNLNGEEISLNVQIPVIKKA